MPINCQICNREFSKMVTNSHLKSHEITTASYKELYGLNSLTSPEFRSELSSSRRGENNPNFGNQMSDTVKEALILSRKGKVPWNKGLMFTDTTIQQDAAKKRENKYRANEMTRKITPPSSETKKKISNGVKQYSKNNHEELSQRAQKAIQTKINKGIDLAFFKGKHHSDESKDRIRSGSNLTNANRAKQSSLARLDLIFKSNLELVDINGIRLDLKCQKCGNEFSLTRQLFTNSKFHPYSCRKCHPISNNRSQKEIDLFEFIKEIKPDAIPNYRFSNSKHEIDIFIPSLNLGIEFNGLYWHSDSVLFDKTADNKKYNKLVECGIRCLVVMEDEWAFQNEIVKARISHILNKNNTRIHTRKCVVREIDSRVSAKFCDLYHIQGKGRSNSRFGLFLDDKLISVMTFSRSNISRKISGWELNRFCSVPGLSIPGSASKLLKAFEVAYTPNNLVTYADRRWSIGDLYEKLGFTYDSTTSPGYWYFLPNEGIRIHRFSLRKNKSDDQLLTEYENRIKQGYLRIWDCGHKKYIKTYK